MTGTSARSSDPRPQAHRGAIALALLSALVALACFGLGAWQLQRRTWKLDLIARVEARAAAPAIDPPPPSAWRAFDPVAAEYRHVAMTGMFRHDRETLVQAVTRLGPGFWVLTPFEIDAGFAILVNRGFVPPERRDPAARAAGNASGLVRVVGLLRASEPGGGFLRRNDPAAGRWFSRDVAAIATARGLDAAAPYFVDADETPNAGGLPVGGLTVLTFRNTHLVYAATWFALALMAAGALAYLLRRDILAPERS